MKFKDLSKITQFVKNFKKEYYFLTIGENLCYKLDRYDSGSYTIIISTGVSTIHKDVMTEFVNFFNDNNLYWFIDVSSYGLIFYVQ